MAINTRSPYYTNSPALNGATYANCRIYIFTGDKNQSLNSLTPKYDIRKDIASPNTFATFEVSELIRDFIDVNFDGSYSEANQGAVWVALIKNTDSFTSTPNNELKLGLESFSYFEEPNFEVSNQSAMISNKVIYHLKNEPLRIPIYTGLNPTLNFLKNNEIVKTISLTSSTLSNSQVKYPSISIASEEYEARVVADGGAFESNQCLATLFEHPVFDLEIDKIQITDDNGTSFINVENIEECKYEPKKITFINKFGALQDVYFFKKSVEKLTVKKESYKANIITSGNTYSTNNHVTRDFNIVGKESNTLSSGFLSEEYNEVFKQLMLSEKVWITNYINGVEQIFPLNTKTSSLAYKTSLNDKLVEYTIVLNNSFDTINNIR